MQDSQVIGKELTLADGGQARVAVLNPKSAWRGSGAEAHIAILVLVESGVELPGWLRGPVGIHLRVEIRLLESGADLCCRMR